MRVVDREPAGAKSFEEAQADIKKLIVDERIKVKKNEFIKSVLEEHRPAIWTIFDDQEFAADKEQQKQNQGPSTTRRQPADNLADVELSSRPPRAEICRTERRPCSAGSGPSLERRRVTLRPRDVGRVSGRRGLVLSELPGRRLGDGGS